MVEGNPLNDIAAAGNVRGVMVAGRWHDRAALDARLERARTLAR